MINRGRINAAIINTSGAVGVIPVASTVIPGATVLYTCTLDGSPVLVLPISAASIRRGRNINATAQVSIPNAAALIGQISARLGNMLIITRKQVSPGGEVVTGQIAGVLLDTINFVRGAGGSSAQLSGSAVDVPIIANRVLSGESIVGSAAGRRRSRAVVDHVISPGDTVASVGGSFIVDTLTINIGALGSTMDLSQ